MIAVENSPKHGDAADGVAGMLGAGIARREGPDKLRGVARYALDQPVGPVAHAVLVQSPIAAGRVVAIDDTAARAAPGVLLVLTHENAPPLKGATSWLGTPPPDGPYLPLPAQVTFSGQQVAAIIAESFEQATAAAALLRITYAQTPAITGLDDPRAGDGTPLDALTIAWGDAEAALAAAPVRISASYATPREYNVPIEPHGLTAQWEGDHLTIWEPSQWLDGMARTYAEWFDVPFENVRLVSPYIGGGFGSKAFTHAHGAIAALAARMLGRPVRLAVTRAQGFTAYGGRPATRQTITLGATREGRLLALSHHAANESAIDAVSVEPMGGVVALM